MTDRPILFSAPMVRAILAGTKTQTRRAFPVQPPPGVPVGIVNNTTQRYGGPGDRMWVRETWRYADWTEEGEPHIEYSADGSRKLIEDFPEEWVDRLTDTWTTLSEPSNFDIDGRAADRRWRPSIHMPRWVSRITLNVTSVRVERLQAISEADAVAEGIETMHEHDRDMRPTGRLNGLVRYPGEPAQWGRPREAFQALWSAINGAESWGSNPWVWCISFERA